MRPLASPPAERRAEVSFEFLEVLAYIAAQQCEPYRMDDKIIEVLRAEARCEQKTPT